jgi:hypothetical protein
LEELYAFYRRAEPMLVNLIRDEPLMPIVQQHFGALRDHLQEGARIVVKGRSPHKAVRAAVGHALAFTTWRSLARDHELDDAHAAELMCRLVAVAQD